MSFPQRPQMHRDSALIHFGRADVIILKKGSDGPIDHLLSFDATLTPLQLVAPDDDLIG